MTKRAAIYIRVSSEKQAEGVSPQAQEADCRALCEQKGYTIVNVYRDIEKYRVGKRMVEPSGSRADRPGLNAMLAAAKEDRFDVIVAWKEDRLYRSYRPMLDVLDTLDTSGIDIELVKETFDKRIAPVKAWAAKMELDAKHDRFMMGVAGRLEDGKPWLVTPPYGYELVDGALAPLEDEAQWVRAIYQWYGEGQHIQEIRRRLIHMGAKQRTGEVSRNWLRPYLYRILNYKTYHTGIHVTQWNGKTYETSIAPIVDPESAQLTAARREKYHQYPAGNLRELALAAGLVYCAACKTSLYMDSHMSRGKRYVYYRCRQQPAPTVRHPDCCKQIRLQVLDSELWQRIWQVIGVPGRLENAIQEHVARLQAQESVATKDVERLTLALDEMSLERQRVITLARKGIINDDDVAQQLFGLDVQVKQLHREIADAKLLTGDRSARLLELAANFRSQFQTGMDAYNRQPQNEQEAEIQFSARRQVVEAIVSRVEVAHDKSIRVGFTLDFARDLFVDRSLLT